jgi:adenosylcobinamide kinase/adenosylcobinamide-phosphate guanylyltransferase
VNASVALILGGARSGKSRRAITFAESASPRRVFLATAEAFDAEMADRISRHKDERDGTWETVEAPRDLPSAIARTTGPDRVVVADCLTLWASNLLLADADMDAETGALDAAVAAAAGPLVLVSNEVGLGIVPNNALARRFRDVAGRINQTVAARAGLVLFVAAGLPLFLTRPADGPWAGAASGGSP